MWIRNGDPGSLTLLAGEPSRCLVNTGLDVAIGATDSPRGGRSLRIVASSFSFLAPALRRDARDGPSASEKRRKNRRPAVGTNAAESPRPTVSSRCRYRLDLISAPIIRRSIVCPRSPVRFDSRSQEVDFGRSLSARDLSSNPQSPREPARDRFVERGGRRGPSYEQRGIKRKKSRRVKPFAEGFGNSAPRQFSKSGTVTKTPPRPIGARAQF